LRSLHPRSNRRVVDTIATNLGISLLTFATGVLLARFLGVEGRGRFAAHFAVLSVAFASGSLGLNYAAAYAAARSGGSAATATRILRLAPAALSLTVVLDLGAEHFLVRGGSALEAALAVAGAASTQGSSIFLGWIQGSRSLGLWNRLRFLQAATNLVVVLALGFGSTLSVATALAAYAGSQIVAAIAAGVLLRIRIDQESGETELSTKDIWRYAGAVAISSSLYQLNQRLDQIFLTLLRRTADLGLYASAVQLAAVAGPIVAGLAQATYGESLHLDHEKRVTLVRRRIRLALAGAGISAIILTTFSKKAMALLYGPAFAAGGTVLAVLSWAAFFLAGNYVAAESLRGGGNSRAPMRADLMTAVVTALLLPGAIWRFGIVGSACVVTVASAVTFGMNYSSAKRLEPNERHRS
jgi:O-antigen/teichoic acid export membrane protein